MSPVTSVHHLNKPPLLELPHLQGTLEESCEVLLVGWTSLSQVTLKSVNVLFMQSQSQSTVTQKLDPHNSQFGAIWDSSQRIPLLCLEEAFQEQAVPGPFVQNKPSSSCVLLFIWFSHTYNLWSCTQICRQGGKMSK